MVDDANRQDVRQPNDGKEANKKLTAESLSDEQLEMIAGAWDDLRNSNTPMADLCEAMSQSKLFDFTSKYNTNNLELRAIASSARETLEARHLAQRNARKQELRHILDAVDSKLTYADKRTALSDLLGFRTIYDMNISDIDHFLADARKELEEIEAVRRRMRQVVPSQTWQARARQVAEELAGSPGVPARHQPVKEHDHG